MRPLVALRVPIDQELLARLGALAPGARDWSEALQWVLDAYEVLTEEDPLDPWEPPAALATAATHPPHRL